MKVRQSRFLRGPNIWAPVRVFELALEPAGSAGQVLVDQLRNLQDIAGTPVKFGAVRETASTLLVAVEYVEETVVQGALDIALRLLASSDPTPTAADVARLRDLAYQQSLPPSIATVHDACKARGIPSGLLSQEYGRYLWMGHGSAQHRMLGSEPDTVSGVARMASTDKYLTKQLLELAGIPVPRGKLASNVDEAFAAADVLGYPLAMKPYDSDLQTGVTLDIRGREQIEPAFKHASEHSAWVMIEQFAPGTEHRVVVVGDKIAAVTQVEPPLVVGDGISSIAELVAQVNRDPRRQNDDRAGAPLSPLKLDDVALGVLAAEGLTPASVPAKGTKVLVRRNPPYFKNGGRLVDWTDTIHPSVAAHSIAAAQMMQIPVAGLDVVAVDITRPLEEQGGVIVEINAGPGLWLHLAPWADTPRPVGDAIVECLFAGKTGRVPVIALVGDADGSIEGELTRLLTASGRRVGVAGNTEMAVDGRRWPMPPGTPQQRAYVLFRNPAVDVAIFRTDPDELLTHGFANDRCDVALLLSASDGEWVSALRHACGSSGRLLMGRDATAADAAAIITSLAIRNGQ
jgi:cyanophycin synthetase